MSTSEEYGDQLRRMHSNPAWGSSADIPAMAANAIAKYDVRSIVDFGCGKGKVTEALRQRYPEVEIIGYDPAIEGSQLPELVDMVFSKDVLEHVEPDRLEALLSDLHRRTSKAQFHLIACHKAIHFLEDGRNAHLIIETPDWWQRTFRSLGFRIVDESVVGEIKYPRGRESIATAKYHCVIDAGR